MDTTNTGEQPFGPGGRIEVASFREVFNLERRIYRVDRLRLNPAGVPLRGVIYFVIVASLGAALAGAPVIGWWLRQLPWYLRFAALPGGIALLGSAVRIEGRPLHLAVRGLLLRSVRPSQLSGFASCPAIGSRWRPPPIVVIPDGSEARPRRFRYSGPGAVVVRRPHEVVEWRRGPVERLLRAPDITIRLARPADEVVRGRSADAGARPGRALTLGAGVLLEIEA